MAQGRPNKWASMRLHENVWLGKRGLEIKVWDKYGRNIKGTLQISIGGIRWFSRMQKKTSLISWDRIAKLSN